MYKNLFMILVAVAFLMSCGGQNTASQDEETTTQEEVVVNEPTVVTPAEFKENAENLVGQEIIIEGNVMHVCQHGGDKMFISGDDPDIRIKIVTGEESTSFQPELEGSYVKVLGIVKAIETEVSGDGEHHGDGEGRGEGQGQGQGQGDGEHQGEGEHHEEGEHEEDAEHEGIYHKAQYSVVCVEFSVIEVSPEEE